MSSKKWPELKRFIPENPHKYVGDVNDIVMRSSWEIKFARYCDTNDSIVKWNSEGIEVPYWSSSDNKMRKYHVDFVIEMINTEGVKQTLMVEIKPYAQTIPPKKTRGKREISFLNECKTYAVNIDKWTHAARFAKERGWMFIVMTEEQLYGKKVK